MNWWDVNVKQKQFVAWVGTKNAQTKKIVRQHVIEKKYKSILDCGSGLCADYEGYKEAGYPIEYLALEECKKFVKRGLKRGINIVEGSIESIPLDRKFDCVHARHVLEHLSSFKKALQEMMRLAEKEIIIVFFLKPAEMEQIRFESGLYHNVYKKNDILEMIGDKRFEFNDHGAETILHIYV